MTRTFGKVEFVKMSDDSGLYEKDRWGVQRYIRGDWGKPGWYFRMSEVAPHVAIKLKSVFEQIRKSNLNKFYFPPIDDICHDLLWFIDRYPMRVSPEAQKNLRRGRRLFLRKQATVQSIVDQEYQPSAVSLKEPYAARTYQIKGAEIFLVQKKMILADYLGLGKSLTAILPMLMSPQKTLPAMIVCQTHLPKQWKEEVLEKFTTLTSYIVPVGKIHDLPKVDVYIVPYSRLAKWGSILMHKVKYIVFDEVQELRCSGSDKYNAAKNLSDAVPYVQGLSHSPIYNYAIEMWVILNCLKEGSVGSYDDWQREWGSKTVRDAKALGSYLRESFLMLRRTDKEVGRELPQLNTIIKHVDYDESEVENNDKLMVDLAMSYYTSSSFMEKGSALREFDLKLRMDTGIAKAKSVAALVKLLLENDKQVLLSGWHRRVYEIWMRELAAWEPVMYTGSETSAQKDAAKKAFMSGYSKVMIISNRSGTGLDGLQFHCNDVVIGELDWSPKVHEQIVGRVNRDGQVSPVTVYYPICDFGSDPEMVDVLALKSSQAHSITDPFEDIAQRHTDESRLKKMAERYLLNHGVNTDELQKMLKEQNIHLPGAD